jgi:hypothetical protein
MPSNFVPKSVHVETRQRPGGRWVWRLLDFLGLEIRRGEAPSRTEARQAGREARDDYRAKLQRRIDERKAKLRRLGQPKHLKELSKLSDVEKHL